MLGEIMLKRVTKRFFLFWVLLAPVMLPQMLVASETGPTGNEQVLSLKAVIDLAINNPDESVYTIKQTLRSAKNSLEQTYAGYLLKDTLALSYTRSGSTSSGVGSASDSNSTALSFTKSSLLMPLGGTLALSAGLTEANLFASSPAANATFTPAVSFTYSQPLSGQAMEVGRYAVEHARTTYQSSLLSFAQSMESLITSTTSSFFSLLSAKDGLESATETEKSSQHLLEIAQAKLSGGSISELDVLKLKVQLASDHNSRLSAEDAYNIAMENFKQLVGFTVMTDQGEKMKPEYANYIFKLDGTINIAPLDGKIDDYIQSALQNQFTWQAQNMTLKLSEDTYLETLVADDPALSLSGSYSKTKSAATALGTLGFPEDDSWSYSASLSIPPFRSRLRELQLEAAKNTLDNARFSYQQARRDLIKQVTQAYHSLKIDQQRMKILESNLAIAQEALAVSEIRYSKGAISVDELIASQLALKTSRTSLISAKTSYLSNYHSFLQATGKLLYTYRPDLFKEYQLPWPK